MEAPNAIDEDWSRRPSVNPGSQGTGTLLKTSTPTSKVNSDVNNVSPRIDDLKLNDDQLRIAAGKLTQIIAKPTEQWQLDQLRREVERIVESVWIR